MHQSTPIFPHVPTQLTSQALVSQAGLGVLTSFLNALDFRRLCEDRLSQFVPATAIHRSGKMIADLAIMLAAGVNKSPISTSSAPHRACLARSPFEATISRFMSRIKDQPAHLSTRSLPCTAPYAPGFGPQPAPATLLLEPPSRTH